MSEMLFKGSIHNEFQGHFARLPLFPGRCRLRVYMYPLRLRRDFLTALQKRPGLVLLGGVVPLTACILCCFFFLGHHATHLPHSRPLPDNCSSALSAEQERVLAHLDSVLVVPEGMEAQDGEYFDFFFRRIFFVKVGNQCRRLLNV